MVVKCYLKFNFYEIYLYFWNDANSIVYSFNYDSNDLDIIKVYDISKLSYILNMNIVGELIWERKEEKELTVEEISELLGYTIKVVSKENKHE